MKMNVLGTKEVGFIHAKSLVTFGALSRECDQLFCQPSQSVNTDALISIYNRLTNFFSLTFHVNCIYFHNADLFQPK